MKLHMPSTSSRRSPASLTAWATASVANASTLRPESRVNGVKPTPASAATRPGADRRPVMHAPPARSTAPSTWRGRRNGRRPGPRWPGVGRFDPSQDPGTLGQFHRGHRVRKGRREARRHGDVGRHEGIDDAVAGRLHDVERGGGTPRARRHGGKAGPAAVTAVLEQDPVRPQALPPRRTLEVRLGYGSYSAPHRSPRHRPRNRGWRFSRKACNPSGASSEVRQ